MHTVEYNCIQVHGAYSCVYMHTDAYTCVQTCTPQDFSSHFPSSSFSSSSLGLACHLSQNSFHPATVCNYASRCMPPHTGMLTSLSSLLSSLLLLSALAGGGSCLIRIDLQASDAEAHVYTIHMLTHLLLPACFLWRVALGGAGAVSCRCDIAISISTAASISIAARSIATATTISIAQAQQAARARQTTHCIHCPACACRTTHTRQHAQHVQCDRHAHQIWQVLPASAMCSCMA